MHLEAGADLDIAIQENDCVINLGRWQIGWIIQRKRTFSEREFLWKDVTIKKQLMELYPYILIYI